ncbi:MAG: hypothetical protein AMXMBFR81_25100 [Chthonomonas sp.]|nr:DUF4446 family protein [Fimbriimonadaceae bacterium]
MQQLLEQLAPFTTHVLLGQSAIIVTLVVVLASMVGRIKRIEASRSTLLRGVTGENLEEIVDRHLREQVRLEGKVDQIDQRTSVIEKKMARTKRHMGIVRYDAFTDVGGQQSFALALLDDNGEGAILNGVVGRSDVRIFCKPLQKGESDRTLSEEEQKALALAVRGR